MSLVREPGPFTARVAAPAVRRGRPPARNEILRNGRLGGFASGHGLSVSVALLVKDRDAGTDARVALEDALR